VKLHRKKLFQGDFREDNFNTAMQVLRDAGDLAKGDQKGRKGGTKGNLELLIYSQNYATISTANFL
jgi:hypothetical protein